MRVARILQREHTRLVGLLGSASDLGRFGIGLVSSVGLLIIPCTILAGSTAGLNWLVGVIGVILGGGAESSWSLLLTSRSRLGGGTSWGRDPRHPPGRDARGGGEGQALRGFDHLKVVTLAKRDTYPGTTFPVKHVDEF